MAAVLRLGCEVVKETEKHFFVCRGAVKLATIPKMMTSGRAQAEILHILGFEDFEYERAMTDIVEANKVAP